MLAIKIFDKEKVQHTYRGQHVQKETEVVKGQQDQKEIEVMKGLKHPNVLQLQEVLSSRDHIFIVQEYAPGGQFFEEILRKG